MADDDKSSKTEAPTRFKLKKAREEGQVPQSKDLASTITFITGLLAFMFSFNFMGRRIYSMLHQNLVDFNHTLVSPAGINQIMIHTLVQLGILMIPMMGALFLVGFIVSASQVGFHVSFKPMEPKIDKINPFNGIKRLISMRGLMSTLISVVKMIAVAMIASTVIWNPENTVALLNLDTLPSIFGKSNAIIFELCFKACMALLIMSIIDFTYQRWQFNEDQKMSKQDIKDEHKQQEGNPQIKGRIKQIQKQAAEKRGLQASVAEADVVVANPFHIAVAIKYDRKDQFAAPIVVAKGARLLAERIKEFARESNVEIVVNVPLARALYKEGQVGYEIPSELFIAVAEVLARIFKKRNSKKLRGL